MRYDPAIHRRNSIRLRGYDYTQPGIYFVTICTYQRLCLFAQPELRRIAEQQWLALTHQRPHLSLDGWIVMPNHLHGLIVIEAPPDGTPATDSHPVVHAANVDRPLGRLGINVTPGSLGAIVRSYKSVVTRRINRLRQTPDEPVWQRGYWERIIRDEHELEATRRYIVENPIRWAEDRDNLDALLARMTALPAL